MLPPQWITHSKTFKQMVEKAVPNNSFWVATISTIPFLHKMTLAGTKILPRALYCAISGVKNLSLANDIEQIHDK